MDPAASEHLDVEVARWLVGADGRGSVDLATERLDRGQELLTVVTELRRAGLDAPRASAASAAATCRRRARARWDRADRLLFTPSGLEQASDPAVSAWRATRFAGHEHVEDRAAGLGGDSVALAAVGARVTASDLDVARLVLLAHNAAVHEVDVHACVADATTHPPPARGPVHVDPARRVDGRRVRRLHDHRPSVPALFAHLAAVAHGPGLAVVLSPGVDLDDPGLPPDVELEFVQVGRDLVEAVAWSGALRTDPSARARATILASAATGAAAPATATSRGRGDRGPRLPVGPVGDLLLEVAPAAVRARLHDELGREVGAHRIADRRALLSVDGDVPASPWWRRRRVETVLPARPNAVKRWLRTVEPRPLELAVHGADVEVETFRRALGRAPRGPGGRRIDLVRLDDGAAAIVTEELRGED